jgi:protein-tyrosine-phosphatase
MFSVRRVKTHARMVDDIRELIGNCPVIIQELLDGHGAGFNLLASNGQVLSSYAHERIHEPLEGGQSSYRKTIALDTYDLREHSEKLIRAIGWTGIAMIEYRISGGKPYVMEINGRLWGSIELGIFAGVNIPRQMIEHFHEGKAIGGSVSARRVAVRNLKMDMRSALSKVVRQRSPRPAAAWLWSLRHTLSSRELVEDHLLRDFGYESAIYWGWAKKAIALLKAQTFPTSLKVNAHRPELRHGMKVGFLCFGNICRSPFAEAYAKSKSGEVEFSSFGFYPHDDRLSPVDAIEAARTFNVDLSNHRSRLLTAEVVEVLDLVFVMDKRNLGDVGRLFPQALAKTFCLSPEKELNDPYGKSREEFIAVYGEIVKAIDDVLKIRFEEGKDRQ